MIEVQLRLVADLCPNPDNTRTHSAEGVEQLARMIAEYGWTQPILHDELIRAGHKRLLAAELIYSKGGLIRLPDGRELPGGTVPVIDCSGWSDDQKRAYVIADNQATLSSEWDMDRLKIELDALTEGGFNLDLAGFDAAAFDAMFAEVQQEMSESGRQGPKLGGLSDEFLIPPFTVLNAREGWWQDRKREWLALGIESEVGRGANLLKFSDTLLEPDPTKRGKAEVFASDAMASRAQIRGDKETKYGKPKAMATNVQNWVQSKIHEGDIELPAGLSANQSGTSIFDPVLCELAYRWFSPAAGLVLDPFAGGSVRGIVAGKLGRRYIGIDLRPEQCEANEAQRDQIMDPAEPELRWICGDSSDVLSLRHDDQQVPDGEVDFIFSCPPYGDLEVYSELAADLSTMKAGDFDAAYARIIDRAVHKLRPDRFACFIVGDYRDAKGLYANFVSKTIAAFEAAGARLYNEAILITAVGSLPIRAAKQFRTTRKMGKTHQNVLVFVKGDPRKATEACGPVDVSDALARVEAGASADDMAGLELGGEI